MAHLPAYAYACNFDDKDEAVDCKVTVKYISPFYVELFLSEYFQIKKKKFACMWIIIIITLFYPHKGLFFQLPQDLMLVINVEYFQSFCKCSFI